MIIPEIFKKVQRQCFQDKEVAVRKKVEKIGSLGSVTTGPGDVERTLKVNFQILSDAVLAKERGLVAGQDAELTYSDKVPAENGDFIEYNGKVYKIVGKLERDSHDHLLLQLMQQEVD